MRYLIILLGLLLIPAAVSAQDVSPRCEAAMDRAAGHYSKCLLSADASFARHENATRLVNRQTRCETRFDRRAARAIHRHGEDACPGAGLVTAMADRTVTYAEGAAMEAGGDPTPSLLFVQNADGGTLSETTLTLTGVSSQTGWFTDRPHRDAGQIPTYDFVAHWGRGENSFADDPPNGDFTCEVGGEVVNYVVELTSPSMAGEDLSYSVAAVGDTVLPQTTVTCEADSHLFIDGVEASHSYCDSVGTIGKNGGTFTLAAAASPGTCAYTKISQLSSSTTDSGTTTIKLYLDHDDLNIVFCPNSKVTLTLTCSACVPAGNDNCEDISDGLGGNVEWFTKNLFNDDYAKAGSVEIGEYVSLISTDGSVNISGPSIEYDMNFSCNECL